MSDLFGGPPSSGDGSPHTTTRQYEDRDEFVITVDLYGYSKDDITAKKGGNRITVRARNDHLGTVERHFTPPRTANLDEITAKFTNGVLTVRVPLEQEEQML